MSAIAFTACSNDNKNEFAVDKTIRLSANIQGQQTRATMANSPNILFLQKIWLFQIKAVPLHYENLPSLFTMLKLAGRFVLLWHIIQRHTHHQLSWWHCFNIVDSTLRMWHVRRTIFATSVITDLVLIFILFWQHRRKIMFQTRSHFQSSLGHVSLRQASSPVDVQWDWEDWDSRP